MPPKASNIHMPAEAIVTCPQCYQNNRLIRQKKTGVYQCGNCQNQLADPFTASLILYYLNQRKDIQLHDSG